MDWQWHRSLFCESQSDQELIKFLLQEKNLLLSQL